MHHLRLDRLILTAFKHVTPAAPLTIVFGDQTRLAGPNGTGKSTVAQAIVWTLFGTTATGDRKVDGWFGPGQTTLETTLHFTDWEDTAHVLHRRRAGRSTTITWDGRMVSDTDITTWIGSREAFVARFDPTFWLTTSEADLRTFVLGLVPMPDPAMVLLLLDEDAQWLAHWQPVDFAQAHGTLAQLRQDLKAAQAALTGSEGALQHARAQLAALPPLPPPGLSLDAATTARDHAQAAYDALVNTPEPVIDESPVVRCRDQWARAQAQAALHPAGWQDPAPLEAQLASLRQVEIPTPDDQPVREADAALRAAETALARHQRTEPSEPHLDQLPASLARSQAQVVARQAQWEAQYGNLATWTAGDPCPVCHTPLSADALAMLQEPAAQERHTIDEKARQVQEAIDAWRDETQRAYAALRMQYKAEGMRLSRRVEQSQDAFESAQAAWQAQQEAMRADKDRLTAEIAQVSQALAAVHEANAALSGSGGPESEAVTQAAAALADAEAHLAEQKAQAHAQRQAQLQAAQEAVRTAQTQWEAVVADTQQRHAYQAQQDAITQLQSQVEAHRTVVDRLTHEIAAGSRYIKAQMQLALAPFLEPLHHVGITLFREKADGSLKEVFQLTYQATPDHPPIPLVYASTSERLKAGVELAAAHAALLDRETPVFIDNAESLLNATFPQAQQIWAVVDDLDTLTVNTQPALSPV